MKRRQPRRDAPADRSGDGDSTAFRRAVEAQKRGDAETALALYTEHLASAPFHIQAWSNLGALFRANRRYQMSLAAQRRAYRLDPDLFWVRVNYANILDDTGQHDEAARLRRRIVAECPDDAEAVSLLVRSERAAGEIDRSVETGHRGLKRFPDDALLRLEIGLSYLTRGDWAQGFEYYQDRWRTGKLERKQVSLPVWAGEPLSGQRLLVIPEQGFGDTVNFCRFLPYLEQQGAEVTMLSKGATARLLKGVEGAAHVAVNSASSSDFDLCTSVMDIPAFYFRTHDTVPPPPRLNLPEDSRQRARSRVAPFTRSFRIGVVWAGSVTNERNAMRSFSHTAFLPLAEVPGVQLFSLYKGPLIERYQRDGSAVFIVDAAGDDRDLADCAATIGEMDLVITSDTVTAHIAGALGVEVWNLLHWEPFWLYGATGETTPWYPSMRLFRQEEPGDWDAVFGRVEAELQKRIPA